MADSIHPIIEKARIVEELRKEKIESRIKELENRVKSCNSRAISQAYILGESKTTLEDARRIAMLIAQFELDCGCTVKSIKI